MTVKLHINIPVRNTSGLDVTVEQPGDDGGRTAEVMIGVLKRLRDAITSGEIRCKSDGWECGDVNADLLDDVVEMHTQIGKWIVRLGGRSE